MGSYHFLPKPEKRKSDQHKAVSLSHHSAQAMTHSSAKGFRGQQTILGDGWSPFKIHNRFGGHIRWYQTMFRANPKSIYKQNYISLWSQIRGRVIFFHPLESPASEFQWMLGLIRTAGLQRISVTSLLETIWGHMDSKWILKLSPVLQQAGTQGGGGFRTSTDMCGDTQMRSCASSFICADTHTHTVTRRHVHTNPHQSLRSGLYSGSNVTMATGLLGEAL